MRQKECIQYIQQIYPPLLSTQKQLQQKTVFCADQHQFYYQLYQKYTNDPLNISQIQEDSQDRDVQMSYLDLEEQYLDADLYGFKYLLLTTLHIQNVNLCELNSLSCLTNLRQLNVSENGIVDITPVQYLINLKYLDFSFNRVVDISVLRFLISLTHIAMISNNIVDVFPLSYLRNLIEQLFQQVCGRRLIELRGLFYVINFVETKQCQACQYFHFAPNKNNANNE
ncbi:Conserved_hypothetical protein [Hexamita inflata]|uniref:Uncharacterized protein n=1 Tax=Hexamita inflata TaxID=28002 RepID=A0AA86R2I1_9EUKA|nr:Conserved hypothetical protein [Hexamita inflata]